MTNSELANRQNMINRLSRIEGQVRGVKKLLTEDNDCEKVMQQMSAARKAFDKAMHEMLGCMIEQNLMQKTKTEASMDEAIVELKQMLSKYA